MTHTKETERAEFEDWAKTVGLNLALAGHRLYAHVEAQAAWMAWTQQAARRAPVVPQSIAQMAVDRYKVVPSHSSMFYPCAVVAGDGQQQLYIGREVECQNMARKFTGAFLDGAFVALTAAPQPPEEGLMSEKRTTKPEAAPVQMPEYGIDTANHAGIRVRGYTEHQVRQLLAAHGIQEQST